MIMPQSYFVVGVWVMSEQSIEDVQDTNATIRVPFEKKKDEPEIKSVNTKHWQEHIIFMQEKSNEGSESINEKLEDT